MALPSTGLVGWKIEGESSVATCIESTKSQGGRGSECEEGAEWGWQRPIFSRVLSPIFSWVFPIGAADLYQMNP